MSFQPLAGISLGFWARRPRSRSAVACCSAPDPLGGVLRSGPGRAPPARPLERAWAVGPRLDRMRGMRAAASRSIHREVGVAAELRGPECWLKGPGAMLAIYGKDEYENQEQALRFLQPHAGELCRREGLCTVQPLLRSVQILGRRTLRASPWLYLRCWAQSRAGHLTRSGPCWPPRRARVWLARGGWGRPGRTRAGTRVPQAVG